MSRMYGNPHELDEGEDVVAQVRQVEAEQRRLGGEEAGPESPTADLESAVWRARRGGDCGPFLHRLDAHQHILTGAVIAEREAPSEVRAAAETLVALWKWREESSTRRTA